MWEGCWLAVIHSIEDTMQEWSNSVPTPLIGDGIEEESRDSASQRLGERRPRDTRLARYHGELVSTSRMGQTNESKSATRTCASRRFHAVAESVREQCSLRTPIVLLRARSVVVRYYW